MTHLSPNWRAAVQGLLAATALMAVQAQAQSYNGGGIFYGGGSSTVGVVAPQPPEATLTWSRSASAFYKLTQLTGSFANRQQTTWSSSGSRFTQYATDLTPATVEFRPSYSGFEAIGGTFSNSLTWTLNDPNVLADTETFGATGGSFTLSNIRWHVNADSSTSIYGRASAVTLDQVPLIEPTEVLAFSVSAADLRTSGSPTTTTLLNLNMSNELTGLMARGLGLAPEGVVYSALSQAQRGMASLSVTASVPEPGTWSLWALGLVGIARVAGLRRRRH